jgi:hypothetical protein
VHRILDISVGAELALDVFVAQESHIWGKMLAMSTQETTVQGYWW